MSDVVLIEKTGPVLVITLNRPEAKNAMNRELAVAVSAAIDQLEGDPSLVVGILTGAGNTFCAGMDLKAFLKGERPIIEGRGFAGITEAPPKKPLIAAVEGYALAGGCELALACDLVVASEKANFGLTEVKRGLVAGAGGLLRLHQRIPRQIAMEYVLTGKYLPGPEAAKWGLVNRLTPEGGALAGARELAAEIAQNAPLSILMSKRIIVESGTWTPGTEWDRQRGLVSEVNSSADAKEGAAAFAEKRAPKWTGK